MSRNPAQGANDFVDTFVESSVYTNNGVYGKMYTVLFPHFKVLMGHRHRSKYPQIEMIRFNNVLLIYEPGRWNSYIGYNMWNDLVRLLKPEENVQNSKEINVDERGCILQLGNERFYIFNIPKDSSNNRTVKVDKDIFSSSATKGKTVVFPVEDTIEKVEDAISCYLDGEMFLIDNRILAVPVKNKNVPTLNHYFSKDDLEFMDNPPRLDGVFVNEESYHQYFGHKKSDEYIAREIAQEKYNKIRQKLVDRRYAEALKYSLGSLMWNPGCESISNNPNYMFIRGPWGIKNNTGKVFTEAVRNTWYTLHAI